MEKCIICQSKAEFFFKKEWELPYKELLESALFYKCTNCGFTYSKTVYDLDFKDWLSLNNDFHYYIENPNNPKQGNQPPYLEQALMLKVLMHNKIINQESIIDYAAGVGTLSQILLNYFDVKLPIFDPYVRSESEVLDYLTREEIQNKNVVFCSALFEHITKIEHLDEIDSLVSNNGILIIHTVVCENIPNNSNWFYIEPPVHCSLFTNKSMSIFMEKYKYISSLYCPSSKSWILFKSEPSNLIEIVNSINALFQSNYLYFKRGFVDYWKGF